MGVVPDRPTTPSSATATSSSGQQQGQVARSPKPASNPMEWMSNLSGDEHVTVFNRITGKKLSGTQGPKLKCLAQWLIENPMFEVRATLKQIIHDSWANCNRMCTRCATAMVNHEKGMNAIH